MTREEKKRFVKNLCDSVRDTVLESVEKMPDEWDGHEIRAYLAEHFEREARSTLGRNGMLGPRSRRLREYRQERIKLP